MSWLDLANFAIDVTGLTLSALGLILSLLIRNVDLWTKRFLLVFFAVLMADVAGDVIATLSLSFMSGTSGAFLTQFGVFLESIFPSILMPMLTLFLLHCSREDWRKSRLFHTALIIWLVYFILLLITQFTDFIYYITDENIYYRGEFYQVLLVPPVLLMALNLFAMYSRTDKLSRNQIQAFRTAVNVPIIAMIAQMIFYGLRFILLGTTISGFILFIYILIEQAERAIGQQIDIKVLQMRPHFIYNIMTSIYYLCDIDAKRAQDTIQNFTVYLRKNFEAVAHTGLIPFKSELEHTKAYLAVEKARYDDLLYVTYDVPDINFSLPPLTLQPIVENAVKYGVDPELSPLHVLIITRRVDNGNKITVEDTGPGFYQKIIEDGSKTHIGIDNVRERLRIMCGGRLDIEPREGGGTIVTLWIPDRV